MPAMLRPKNKATKIALAVLGEPWKKKRRTRKEKQLTSSEGPFSK